jgi:hypothetical protein
VTIARGELFLMPIPIFRPLNKNIKIIVNYILGPAVFLLLSYFIYRQMVRQPDWKGSLSRIFAAVRGPAQWRLWLVVLLMPLNWGIEARKWQLALRPAGGISFGTAFKAVMTGTTLGAFTPNRMGEYLGRILYIEDGRRVAAISLTFVCSISQLMITLLAGLGGITYLLYYIRSKEYLVPGMGFLWLKVLLLAVVLLLAGLTILYWKLPRLLTLLTRIPWFHRYTGYLKNLESFHATILLRILFLSFGRYIVFTVQYGLLFPVFGIFLGAGQVWSGLSVVFLLMAVIPSFTFLTELGLRWEASIQVMELFTGNAVGIFATSFAIWVINLIIPALIGSLLIMGIKLFRR